jgi:hypothetical protein
MRQVPDLTPFPGHGARACYRAAVRRLLGILLAVGISAVAAVGALRVTLPADTESGVRRQLATLRAELDGGAAATAQAGFPEGYFFMFALYGLTEVQVGLDEPPADRADQVRESRWALAKIDSAEGRAPFDPALTPAYGIFYRGWTNWLRGGVLALQPDPAEQTRFAADSAEIAAAFDAAQTPFLSAYANRSWPVDSAVAVASLHLYDALFPARYGPTVSRWLAAAKRHLDPATGLLPHETDALTGATVDGARGSSQSMLLRFLAEVDPAYARAQYLRFRDLYQVEPLGLGPAIREYPTGSSGVQDVDSGPLILGVSLPATVVTIGAWSAHWRISATWPGSRSTRSTPASTPSACNRSAMPSWRGRNPPASSPRPPSRSRSRRTCPGGGRCAG